MSKLPRHVGLLSGIMAFCAAAMVGLCRDCPPTLALKKAALCAMGAGAIGWIAMMVAIAVVREGFRNHQGGDGG